MKYKLITLLALLSIAGCSDVAQTTDSKPAHLGSQLIRVSITDCNNVKLYSEDLPLIYVQQFREVTTNSNGDFTFNFSIPTGWSLLFESETISFSSSDEGSVPLNFNENTYYQFAITTQ